MKRPFPNSYWVVPGSLLAGEYPYSEEPLPERATLGLLLKAGIDAFVDLTQPGERPEYRALLPSGASYLRKPIMDMGIPQQIDEMRVIQMHLRALLGSGRRVYVHCRAGIGRTGTVIGCYLAEQGLDGPEALNQLNRLWRQCARSAFFSRVPQTPEQEDYIRMWAERPRQDSGPAIR
jgi:hypothetical protein